MGDVSEMFEVTIFYKYFLEHLFAIRFLTQYWKRGEIQPTLPFAGLGQFFTPKSGGTEIGTILFAKMRWFFHILKFIQLLQNIVKSPNKDSTTKNQYFCWKKKLSVEKFRACCNLQF